MESGRIGRSSNGTDGSDSEYRYGRGPSPWVVHHLRQGDGHVHVVPGDRSIHSEDSIQNRIECSEYDLLFWLLIKSDKVTDIVSDKVESKSERIDYDYVIVDDIPEFDISPTIL